MPVCRFSIPFSGSADQLLSRARSAIESQGGLFNGNGLSGTFHVNVLGDISGSFAIAGHLMDVSIDSKPIFIPCSQIESFMMKQFGS